MIQLATAPNASRSNWRPVPAEAKDNTLSGRRPRSGHAWPFMTPYAEQATSSQDSKRIPTSGSGT
jgi:hypothetical protein